MASSPWAGEGTDCGSDGPPECGVPINTSLSLRFDRFLKPASAVRQSVQIYTGSPSNTVGLLLPEYDLVERVVTYRLTQTLEPGTLYTVELLTPSAESGFGFEAFDGARLEEREAPVRYHFFTRRSRTPAELVPLEEVPTCERIVEILSDAGCANAGCHGGSVVSMGLALDSRDALRATALGEVAHQTEFGASVGEPLKNPGRFGVQMPVIDAGQPANSYLMYKLLSAEQSYWLAPDEPGLCSTRYALPTSSTCLPPSRSELARLREWFVRGAPMPPAWGEARGLLRGELRELQRFIADGATCP